MAGLFGKDDLEAFYIDTVIDTADDIVPPWDLIFFATSEEEKVMTIKINQNVGGGVALKNRVETGPQNRRG